MKSRATPDFWSHYNRLPSRIQKSAKQAYARFRQNPNHPSLRLKKVHTSQEIYSVRVSYQSPSQSSQKQQLKTPSLRFPLRAGGTACTRGAVPLAKRGEPKGGGQLMNSDRAIGIKILWGDPCGFESRSGHSIRIHPLSVACHSLHRQRRSARPRGF